MRVLSEVALPDSDHRPTPLTQLPGDSSVPGLVAFNFFLPRPSIRLRCDVLAAVVTVPKATIHKNGDHGGSPSEIRLPGKRLMPAPSGQMSLAKQGR